MSRRNERRCLRFEQLETKFTLSSFWQTFANEAAFQQESQLLAEFQNATADDAYSTSVQSLDVLEFVHANTYDVPTEPWHTPTAEECQQADTMLAMYPHELRKLA